MPKGLPTRSAGPSCFFCEGGGAPRDDGDRGLGGARPTPPLTRLGLLLRPADLPVVEPHLLEDVELDDLEVGGDIEVARGRERDRSGTEERPRLERTAR